MRKNGLRNMKMKGLRNILLCAAAIVCLGMNSLTADAATGTVTAASARIRSTASTSGEELAGVIKGDTVDIISKTEGADGKTWYQVHVNGSTKGYILSDLVSVSSDVPTAAASGTEELSASTDNLQNEATETTATVTESSATSGTVKSASVNIRKGPATTDAIVGNVKKNVSVTITGEAIGSDGKRWFQVSVVSGGKDVKGFILAELIEETTEVPEEETPPEPTQEAEPEETGGDEIDLVISSKVLPADADISSLPIDESMLASMEAGRYYLLYMKGEDGSKFYYLYDLDSHAYQRADSFNTGVPEDEKEAGGSGGFGTTAKVIVIILSVVIVILIAIIVLLVLKLRGNNWDDEDDEEDEDEEDEDEEDDEEDGRVNSRAWRPKNFLHTSEDDEDEEEEEDDLPRRPVRRTPPRQEGIRRSAAQNGHSTQAPRRRPEAEEGGEAPRRRPAADGRSEAVRRRPETEERGEAPRRRPAADGRVETVRRRPEAEDSSEIRRRPTADGRGEAVRRRPDTAEGGEAVRRRPAAAPHNEAPRKKPAAEPHGEAPRKRPDAEGRAEAPRRKPAQPRKSYYEEDDEFEFEFLNMDGKDDL